MQNRAHSVLPFTFYQSSGATSAKKTQLIKIQQSIEIYIVYLNFITSELIVLHYTFDQFRPTGQVLARDVLCRGGTFP
ncbi:MAG: hypothetical protein GYB58_07520 [Gammaproteobacteria bacterium]|nr:hypothetical protein [Gammaproteobacteria bacterium]